MTNGRRTTPIPCIAMWHNDWLCSHTIQVWGIVSFILVRFCYNHLSDKRKLTPHFLFVYIHNPTAKREFAENPVKSRHQLKLIFFNYGITLWRYISLRGGLKEGMYVNVPTNWATDSSGNVSTDAISEIMEALDDKYITISGDDYDHVFFTFKVENWQMSSFPRRPGWRAGKVLLRWKKV